MDREVSTNHRRQPVNAAPSSLAPVTGNQCPSLIPLEPHYYQRYHPPSGSEVGRPELEATAEHCLLGLNATTQSGEDGEP